MIHLLLILFSFQLNSQTFKSTRNLIEDKKDHYRPILSLGVGVDYLFNSLTNTSEDNCSCMGFINSHNDSRNLAPSIYLKYRHNETSDFSFDLSVSYFNVDFISNYLNSDTPLRYEDREIMGSMIINNDYNINYYDIGFYANYELFGFKQVGLFSGFKTRIGNSSFNRVLTFTDNNNQNLSSLGQSQYYGDDVINFSVHLGVSFNGKFGDLPYQIRFNYLRNLNDINFNIDDFFSENSSFDVNYNLTSFGIGLVLFYDFIK